MNRSGTGSTACHMRDGPEGRDEENMRLRSGQLSPLVGEGGGHGCIALSNDDQVHLFMVEICQAGPCWDISRRPQEECNAHAVFARTFEHNKLPKVSASGECGTFPRRWAIMKSWRVYRLMTSRLMRLDGVSAMCPGMPYLEHVQHVSAKESVPGAEV